MRSLVYFAAGLFNVSDCSANIVLSSVLERSYTVFLPQRNGFEFSRLSSALEKKIGKEEAETAVKPLIYLLDMGIFLPRSRAVIGKLDEPLDSGEDIELSYARMMNKLVIGYRTDSRSPFGSIQEPMGGIHFFPAFQCDYFIRMPEHAFSTTEEMQKAYEKLGKAIVRIIEHETPRKTIIPRKLKPVIELANQIFPGEIKISSPDYLQGVAERYQANKARALELMPQVAII